MILYFLKRLALAIPTLIMISLVMFWLSGLTPVHPVEQLFQSEQIPQTDYARRAADFSQKAHLLGLDKPAFYFSIQAKAYPDTLYKVFPSEYKEQLIRFIDQTADAQASSQWLNACLNAQSELALMPDSLRSDAFNSELSSAAQSTDLVQIQKSIYVLDSIVQQNELLHTVYTPVQTAWQAIASAASQQTVTDRLPRFVWHGLQNRYHAWFKAFCTGDFGLSYKNRRPVRELLTMRLKRTASMGLMSILLAFGIGIPLGVITARSNQQIFQSTLVKSALFIYAIPVFWLGSLFILFFATPFAHMQIFRFGCGTTTSPTLFEWLSDSASCLVLPIICMSLHIGVGIFLQMRTSMADVLKQDYIRTARVKGLTESQVVWRHAFPNAIFPIITMLGGVFAFIVAGSVVIEYLFDIPGMGSALIEAYSSRDYPVLFAILMLFAITIVIGNLIADLLYAWLDPRVRY